MLRHEQKEEWLEKLEEVGKDSQKDRLLNKEMDEKQAKNFPGARLSMVAPHELYKAMCENLSKRVESAEPFAENEYDGSVVTFKHDEMWTTITIEVRSKQN